MRSVSLLEATYIEPGYTLRNMTTVPLNVFVDFMLTAGVNRLTMARELAVGNSEHFAEFYGPVRDVIVNMHEHGYGADILDAFIMSRSDPRERRVFPKVVAGYQKFLKSAKMTWFVPPLREWPLAPLSIRIAPELGLLIDGRPHAIKLYFRGDPPESSRISLTAAALFCALSPTWPGTVFALLDVRRARLYAPPHDRDAFCLLHAEATALGSLLSSLQ